MCRIFTKAERERERGANKKHQWKGNHKKDSFLSVGLKYFFVGTVFVFIFFRSNLKEVLMNEESKKKIPKTETVGLCVF